MKNNLLLILGIAIMAVSIFVAYGCITPDYSKANYSIKNVTFAVFPGSSPMLGSKDAPITIVEFTDYQCPYCRRYAVETFPSIESNFITSGKVNYYLRDFPLQIHLNSNKAATAARCAGEQGKYWEMHKLLFEKQSEWGGISNEQLDSKLTEFATNLGINDIEFSSCISSGKFASSISQDTSEGSSYGVTGTPTSLVLLPKTTDESKLISILKKYPEYVDRGLLSISKDPEGRYIFIVEGAFPFQVFKEILES